MMTIRRFLHLSAIMISSLMALVSHGQAKVDTSKKARSNGHGELSKAHGVEDEDTPMSPLSESKRPPLHLDPALMASAQLSTPTVVLNGSGTTPATDRISEKTRYPWKLQIVTTTFWVGEAAAKNNPVPNRESCWDTNWLRNFGGYDNPARSQRSDYIPVKFVPQQNPFYVALPYNDLGKGGYKIEAEKVIPWFKRAKTQSGKSVCKGRWLAIRFKNKIAYAQWEDAGPFRTDHWEYVFGNERPKPNLNRGAGLDVSPAVRDYLGMNDTDVTDWRFVDFDEIPQGPWAKHGDNNPFVMNKRSSEQRLARMDTESPTILTE